jgi:dihydroorotate dehydrogenase electron transfer subunit
VEVILLPKVIEHAVLTEHRSLGESVRWLTLKAPQVAKAALPGQFVHVRIGRTFDPLLRRPMSIAAANHSEGTISLIYRIVGRGTAELARLQPGEELDVMGPLGTGFDLNAQQPLLVGGGMGLAPLLFLAQELCPRPVSVVMGGRTATELYWQHLFAAICQNIHITTDDGTLGRQGVTLDLLPDLLKDKLFDKIYTCGPYPMMTGVARLARSRGIVCQISLEDYMACGMGACLSCTCAATDGTRRKICTDGPVFDAEEVLEQC